jgi:hypothetical protein
MLWKKGKAKKIPKNYIHDSYFSCDEIKEWIKSGIISNEEIVSLIFAYLKEEIAITNRNIFYKHFNYIKYLLPSRDCVPFAVRDEDCVPSPPILEDRYIAITEEDKKSYLTVIKEINNDFYNIILWTLDKDDTFDFDTLKSKFIYFEPNEQIRIVRKLFHLKATNKFELTIEKLNELTRFDLDLYKINQEFHQSIPVDISTDVIIQALTSFQKNNKFLVEGELLSIVLKDLNTYKTKKFKIEHYFEQCKGRQTAEFDWESNGKIRKIRYGINQFYFAIEFDTGEKVTSYNRRGSYEAWVENPNFEEIKEAVKLLPGRKWNKEQRHWGVPSKYEPEVLLFAKENRFFLDFEGSYYRNNIHLAKFKVTNILNGIRFCEGRQANKPDENFNKEFWWCTGQPCFEKCETIHTPDKWE